MSLAQLLARKQLVILGMNSGTSADGLDLAALRMSSSAKDPAKYLAGKCIKYPPLLRNAVLKMSDTKTVELNHVIYLDNLLGRFYGTVATRFMAALARRGITVDAIASHGQTVRHLPGKTRYLGHEVHGTLQIGSLETIATLTSKPVVGDFRQADIALGNEGAPITVAAMARLFGHSTRSRLVVNIGGMANYFYFPTGAEPSRIRAADTGPGNAISDLLCRALYNRQYDPNGVHASRGMVSRGLLRSAKQNSSVGGMMISTGRELFGAELAADLIKRGRSLRLSKDDIIATGLEITVHGLRRHLLPLLKKDSGIDKLYLTGGGIHNSFLVSRLRQVLAPCRVASVSELGFDPDLVEASAYAVMGQACLRSEPLSTQFGRRHQDKFRPVSGRIVQPPVQLR